MPSVKRTGVREYAYLGKGRLWLETNQKDGYDCDLATMGLRGDLDRINTLIGDGLRWCGKAGGGSS